MAQIRTLANKLVNLICGLVPLQMEPVFLRLLAVDNPKINVKKLVYPTTTLLLILLVITGD